jgi:hypothetical protein
VSYTFAICNAPLSATFDEAAQEVERMTEEPEPNPAVLHELIDRLTARYPCICDLPDDDDSGTWCSGPLRKASYPRAYVMGLVFSRVDEVLPFVIATATGLGLTVLDWQTGTIHRPAKRKGKQG